MLFQIEGRKKGILVKKGVQKGVQKGVKKGVFGCFWGHSGEAYFQESQKKGGFQALPSKKGSKRGQKEVKKCHFGPFLRVHISETEK